MLGCALKFLLHFLILLHFQHIFSLELRKNYFRWDLSSLFYALNVLRLLREDLLLLSAYFHIQI